MNPIKNSKNIKLNEKLKFNSSYLRQTLLTQAQFFLRESQESNQLSLVTTLDSEKWTQADVSMERQGQINCVFYKVEQEEKDAKTLTRLQFSNTSSTTEINNLETVDEIEKPTRKNNIVLEDK